MMAVRERARDRRRAGRGRPCRRRRRSRSSATARCRPSGPCSPPSGTLADELVAHDGTAAGDHRGRRRGRRRASPSALRLMADRRRDRPTRRTRGSPTTATCATSSCARHLEAEHGLFLAEGEKVVRRAVEAGFAPRSFLMAPRWLDGLADVLGDHRRALLRAVARRSPRRSPASTSTAARSPRCERRPLPSVADVLAGARSVLVLEDLVDHTNVGAIFRCGAALGFDAVLLSPRCADPLYRRSIKVGMGAVFALPWTRLPDWYDALPDALRPRVHHGRADPGRRTRYRSRTPCAGLDRVALVLGRRGTASRRAGSQRRPARDHPDARRASTRSTWPPTAVPATSACYGRPLRSRGTTALGPIRWCTASRRGVTSPSADSSTLSPPSAASCAAWCGSRSPNTVPAVWSVSCCRHRASRPSPLNRTGSPSSPAPSTRGVVGPGAARRTRPGSDRQPSSPSSSWRSLPSGSGQHRVADHARRCARRTSSGQSKTNIARSSPIWQAARPTPSAAYIVATMSAASDAARRRTRSPAAGAGA